MSFRPNTHVIPTAGRNLLFVTELLEDSWFLALLGMTICGALNSLSYSRKRHLTLRRWGFII